jgi:phosphoribosylformylglycinamidine synthase I
MPTPRVLILRAPGTNCDHETAFAFEKAGGRPEMVHVSRLLEDPQLPHDYQILCLPGGFSYGDDIAAGRILANQLRHHLKDTLNEFKAAHKLILGICNGFQVLVQTGMLLPTEPDVGSLATLTWNDSGKFEDLWVNLAVDGDRCVFLKDIDRIYLPIAHAEGKFVVRDTDGLNRLKANGQLALRYCDDSEQMSDALLPFPTNPNGSAANVAGVCDDTGRVLGLMPHPERHIDLTHHPRWTRGEGQDPGDGLALFQNAVKFFE